MTDGDAGGFDPTVPRSEIPAIRRAEQERRGQGGRRHRRALPRLPRRRADREPGPAPRHHPGHPAGPSAADPHPDARAQLGAHRRLAPRPHGRGRGGDPGGLPRRPQPLRAPVAARRRGPRRLVGARGLGHGPPHAHALRRHHRPVPAQDRRPARARVADRTPRRTSRASCAAGTSAPRTRRGYEPGRSRRPSSSRSCRADRRTTTARGQAVTRRSDPRSQAASHEDRYEDGDDRHASASRPAASQ